MNPNPFKKDGEKVNYEEEYPGDKRAKVLDSIYSYNVNHNWNYEDITKLVGGGIGIRVETNKQLEDAIKLIKTTPDELFVVNVIIPQTDAPTKVPGISPDKLGADKK